MLNDAREWNQRLRLELLPEALTTWTQELRDRVHPPLTANRTMGALGGIVASRIAREFKISRIPVREALFQLQESGAKGSRRIFPPQGLTA